MHKEKNNNKIGKNISRLRTLKSDTSAYIKKEGISMVDMMASQAKKEGAIKFKHTKETTVAKKILLSLLILLTVMISGVAGFFLYKQKQTKQQPNVAVFLPVVMPDKKLEIPVTNIGSILKVNILSGEFVYLPIINNDGGFKRALSTREFFNTIGVVPAPGLIDSFYPNFMLSVFRKKNKSPILIFKIKSYEYAFASMLRWEKDMLSDLNVFLGLRNTEMAEGFFEDKEIENKDVRVVYDSDGNPILFYSFVNRRYLVVTTTEEALRESFRRLTSPRYLNN